MTIKETLESATADAVSRMEEMEDDISSLSDIISDLRDTVAERDDQISDLEGEIEDLKEQLEQFRGEDNANIRMVERQVEMDYKTF